jgi:hypothetical protein
MMGESVEPPAKAGSKADVEPDSTHSSKTSTVTRIHCSPLLLRAVVLCLALAVNTGFYIAGSTVCCTHHKWLVRACHS